MTNNILPFLELPYEMEKEESESDSVYDEQMEKEEQDNDNAWEFRLHQVFTLKIACLLFALLCLAEIQII